MKFRWLNLSWLLILVGCAGAGRSCSSCTAENFGADWVVVQMDMNGKPYRCWELQETSITNEPHSDGIYWKDPAGNLIHLSGHYNRVQVERGNWDHAFTELGITRDICRQIRAWRYSVETDKYERPSAPPQQE